MNPRSLLVLVGAVMLSGLLVSVGRAQPRETLSLDGVWNFATDLDNQGEIEKWFRSGAKLPAMPLPGYGLRSGQPYGHIVYDHPVAQTMAPNGWCDDGWFHLVEGGRKYSLEAAPVRPQVIIRALPTLEKVADEAMLFEVAVGKGCLVVSGLNHERAQGRPENQWLLARLLEYAAGFPQPKAKWPAAFLLH